ncbi:phenylalanine--tRNA ligase subunit alpha [Methanopyrus sp. KOL6]|uniref:phenylalanine--tRNA ligase subunit alpha n=1 Tax=Methanopyrus sp. KOL6 TaxID=1937004 RepID=UPI000B4A6EB1|nr:phenylalanine--tRNA ligase subunit alpha [Methanopyrus sp. KOL6]
MDPRELAERLTERDLRILIHLAENEEATPEELAESLGVDLGPVMRSLYWLEERGLIESEEETYEVYELGDEGKEYAEEGLPELRVVEVLRGMGGEGRLEEVLDRAGVPRKLAGPILGWLRRKGLAEIKREGGETLLVLLEEEPEDMDQSVLEALATEGPMSVEELARRLEMDEEEMEKVLKRLSERGDVLRAREETVKKVRLTERGEEVAEHAPEVLERDWITELKPEHLREGTWKEKEFKPYDVKAPTRPTFPGKRHPLKEVIDEIRRVFLEMGFVEVSGPLVESSFWNFDALFQPQDHAAREMQDTFYLEEPAKAELPDGEIVEKVRAVHEDGGDTGSRGWGYEWDEGVARKTVLRTHTTAVSVRKLYEVEGPPLKAFSIGRVYRRETVDYKHLPEFHQCEGIVLARDVSFRDLLGILEEFYRRMGFEEIRFRPAYFPYTVLSVEPEVYFEEKGDWVELGGAGIFRPEVIQPLGFDPDVVCLAWGLGVERLAMLKLGIDDIRDLYMSDLKTLLELPTTRARR